MSTIKDFLGNEWTVECLGCSIANGEIGGEESIGSDFMEEGQEVEFHDKRKL